MQRALLPDSSSRGSSSPPTSGCREGVIAAEFRFTDVRKPVG
jgi:hypothetical protein